MIAVLYVSARFSVYIFLIDNSGLVLRRNQIENEAICRVVSGEKCCSNIIYSVLQSFLHFLKVKRCI